MAPKKAELNVSVNTPIPAKIIAVPAKEKATGKPANNIKQTTANINSGINSTTLDHHKRFNYF